MWRDIKREKWDHRKSRFSSRIPERSELYVGYCSRGAEQNSYSFSVLRCGGRIWLFIFIWRTSSSCKLQDKVSTHWMFCECLLFVLRLLVTLEVSTIAYFLANVQYASEVHSLTHPGKQNRNIDDIITGVYANCLCQMRMSFPLIPPAADQKEQVTNHDSWLWHRLKPLDYKNVREPFDMSQPNFLFQ